MPAVLLGSSPILSRDTKRDKMHKKKNGQLDVYLSQGSPDRGMQTLNKSPDRVNLQVIYTVKV